MELEVIKNQKDVAKPVFGSRQEYETALATFQAGLKEEFDYMRHKQLGTQK